MARQREFLLAHRTQAGKRADSISNILAGLSGHGTAAINRDVCVYVCVKIVYTHGLLATATRQRASTAKTNKRKFS